MNKVFIVISALFTLGIWLYAFYFLSSPDDFNRYVVFIIYFPASFVFLFFPLLGFFLCFFQWPIVFWVMYNKLFKNLGR